MPAASRSRPGLSRATRGSYHALELARWRDYLQMPLNLEPRHYPKGAPTDPDWNKSPGWMVIAAQLQGQDAFVLSHALLRGNSWVEERDTSLPEGADRGRRRERLRRRGAAQAGTQPGPGAGRTREVHAGGGGARHLRRADLPSSMGSASGARTASLSSTGRWTSCAGSNPA